MKKATAFATLIILVSLLQLSGQNPQIEQSLRRHVEILASDSLGGRGFQSPDKALSIDYITTEFNNAGFAKKGSSYIVDFKHLSGVNEVEGQNIIGVIEGSDPLLKDEYIILGAHYDHLGKKMMDSILVVYNGADDNASGVAAIIETGRYLMSVRGDLKRTVLIVAFDGEESGLIGSSAFVTDKVIEPSQIKAMFSIDMVGMYEKRGGVEIKGINSIKQGKAVLESKAKETGVIIAKSQNSIEMRTDTWPFGEAGAPAVSVTTGTISPYHKPEDDSDLLDYKGMSMIVELLSSMVFELATIEPLETNSAFIKHVTDPGVQFGLILSSGSNFHLYKDDFFNGKSVSSFEAGLTSWVKLSNHFALQTGLVYELTGGKTASGLVRFHSLTPQISIVAGTSTASLNEPSGFIFAGGYYRYNFEGVKDGSHFNYTEEYYKTEPGIMAGIGFKYNNIQFSFQRKYSLNRINTDLADGNIYNRSKTFSLIKYF